MLYRLAMDGSDIERVGLLTQDIQAMALGNDGLIAIGYDNFADENVLRAVDTESGAVSDIMSFEFKAGSWEVFIVPDREAGVIYATDTEHRLYKIAMDGSEVDVVGQWFDPHIYMGLGVDGLIGIAENDKTKMLEVLSLSTTTAEVSSLISFEFDTAIWDSYVVTDPDAGVFYATSAAQTLYRFQMDGSAVEAVATLDTSIQAMGMGPYN